MRQNSVQFKSLNVEIKMPVLFLALLFLSCMTLGTLLLFASNIFFLFPFALVVGAGGGGY